MPEELVLLGVAEKPHGLKGALSFRIDVGLGDPEFPVGVELILEGIGRVTVARCIPRKDSRFSLTFREIRSRTEAEDYRGSSLYAPRAWVRDKLGFVPIHAFIGFALNARDTGLEVVDVEPSIVNPMLVLDGMEKRFTVPLVMVASLGEIDWEERSMNVDLPEGLEDLDL